MDKIQLSDNFPALTVHDTGQKQTSCQYKQDRLNGI